MSEIMEYWPCCQKSEKFEHLFCRVGQKSERIRQFDQKLRRFDHVSQKVWNFGMLIRSHWIFVHVSQIAWSSSQVCQKSWRFGYVGQK